MMLREALRLLLDQTNTLDAWTREDQQAIGWYEAQGFVQNEHYLHVYKNGEERSEGFASPEPLSVPVLAFTHARIEHEASLRSRFSRVYVCRQMLRVL